ncbi:hypothetical protein LAZ67_17000519 [Cordylochernes scorpioides]|uniref:Integrase p58-like C-terminal domain-containing protein n=1 Tax=Cordylochernes scorpioides TaxID=51811 RepID=A0ABY6LCT1_9ARAC|nr:hypothetical protein LAZ67_17000519 [Cordylochernes scorpioides]
MFGVLPPELSDHTTPYPDIGRARKIAHTRTQNKHLRDKNVYDQRHKQPRFEIGDLVLVKIYYHPNTGKLAPYFTGPYTILEIISPIVVRIDRPNQPLQRDTDTVHVNKLKLYTENIQYITPPIMKIHHLQHEDNCTFPFKHLTPEIFPTEPLTIKPTNSEPFIHLDPTIFTKTRFVPFSDNTKSDIAHPQVRETAASSLERLLSAVVAPLQSVHFPEFPPFQRGVDCQEMSHWGRPVVGKKPEEESSACRSLQEFPRCMSGALKPSR